MGGALTPPLPPAVEAAPPVSLWLDPGAGGPQVHRRPPLAGDLDADVAIVGAGYTGLWTAYYLLRAAPRLRVVLVEAEYAGFGASGRNGGWASALFPRSLAGLAAISDRGGALAMDAALRASITEVIRVTEAEGVDARAARAGTLVLARSRAQETRARAEVAEARHWGLVPDRLRWLDAGEARGRLAGTRVRGATFTPDCAALDPGRLVRGLADVVVRGGARLAESTRALSIRPGRVDTDRGTVRAATVVRATEGYTPRLRGQRRVLAPVYSLVVASEPLPPQVWARIGLARRETFADHRHLVIYGQRTADDRLVFGGRGAPYHLGSAIRPEYERVRAVFAAHHATLLDLFPVLAGARFTHAWGGPLGVARDWCASVGLDRRRGLAWAGGYVGDGVTTSNLAGRTLADLVLDRDTELTRLPWVGHRSPRWEPEPLRWAGINLGLKAAAWADAEERLTGRPSVLALGLRMLLG